MDIHQLSVNYDAEQDRLLLRISSQQGQELRVWWTRRLVLIVWPHLLRISESFSLSKSPQAAHDDLTRKMMTEFMHQEIVSQADFKTPYKDGTDFPLGEAPILLYEVSLSASPNSVQLRGKGLDGKQFEISLTDTFYHAMLHLIQQVCAQAQWGLQEQNHPNPELANATDSTQDRPRYLN